jgi:hypothetical protein
MSTTVLPVPGLSPGRLRAAITIDPGLGRLLEDHRLGPLARQIATKLVLEWAWTKSTCFPSDATIAAKVGGAHPKSVNRALAELARYGYILRRKMTRWWNHAWRQVREIVLLWRCTPGSATVTSEVTARLPEQKEKEPLRENEENNHVTHAHEKEDPKKVPGEALMPPTCRPARQEPLASADASLVILESAPTMPIPIPEPVAVAAAEPVVPAGPPLPFDPSLPLLKLVPQVPGLPADAVADLAEVFCDRLRIRDHNAHESYPFWRGVLGAVARGAPVQGLRACVEAAVAVKNRGTGIPGKVAASVWRRCQKLAAAHPAPAVAAAPTGPIVASPAPPEPAVPPLTVALVVELEEDILIGDRGLRRFKRSHLAELARGGSEVPPEVQSAAVAALERLGPAPR